MITAHKQLLRGTPDDVRATAEHLARGQGHREYLAGTRLRELAIELAACNGLTVSAVRYDDMAGYELEVTLENAPHLDPVVIGRSRTGTCCSSLSGSPKPGGPRSARRLRAARSRQAAIPHNPRPSGGAGVALLVRS